MSNTIDKPGFYHERQSGKYYRWYFNEYADKFGWVRYSAEGKCEAEGFTVLPPGDYVPLVPAATNAEAREELLVWLKTEYGEFALQQQKIADKAAEIFGRVERSEELRESAVAQIQQYLFSQSAHWSLPTCRMHAASIADMFTGVPDENAGLRGIIARQDEEITELKATIARLEGEVAEAKRKHDELSSDQKSALAFFRNQGWSGKGSLMDWLEAIFAKLATPAPEVIEGKGQWVTEEQKGWYAKYNNGRLQEIFRKSPGHIFYSESTYVRLAEQPPETFPPRVPFTPPPKPEQHLIRWHRIDGTHVDMWATKHGNAWRGTEDGCTYTRVELLDETTGEVLT